MHVCACVCMCVLVCARAVTSLLCFRLSRAVRVNPGEVVSAEQGGQSMFLFAGVNAEGNPAPSYVSRLPAHGLPIFFLIHRSHSISFTRAQGIPKYNIGFGRGKGW